MQVADRSPACLPDDRRAPDPVEVTLAAAWIDLLGGRRISKKNFDVANVYESVEDGNLRRWVDTIAVEDDTAGRMDVVGDRNMRVLQV